MSVREHRSHTGLGLVQRKWEIIGELAVKEYDLICLNVHTVILIIKYFL